jgi:hypothetical protein
VSVCVCVWEKREGATTHGELGKEASGLDGKDEDALAHGHRQPAAADRQQVRAARWLQFQAPRRCTLQQRQWVHAHRRRLACMSAWVSLLHTWLPEPCAAPARRKSRRCDASMATSAMCLTAHTGTSGAVPPAVRKRPCAVATTYLSTPAHACQLPRACPRAPPRAASHPTRWTCTSAPGPPGPTAASRAPPPPARVPGPPTHVHIQRHARIHTRTATATTTNNNLMLRPHREMEIGGKGRAGRAPC